MVSNIDGNRRTDKFFSGMFSFGVTRQTRIPSESLRRPSVINKFPFRTDYLEFIFKLAFSWAKSLALRRGPANSAKTVKKKREEHSETEVVRTRTKQYLHFAKQSKFSMTYYIRGENVVRHWKFPFFAKCKYSLVHLITTILSHTCIVCQSHDYPRTYFFVPPNVLIDAHFYVLHQSELTHYFSLYLHTHILILPYNNMLFILLFVHIDRYSTAPQPSQDTVCM